MNGSLPKQRLPLMGMAILLLLAAMWAGLVRMGWGWPPLRPTLPMAHGPLMVSGFLGALISLERAVAIERRWGYGAPLLAGLGGILVMVGVPGWPGPLLISLASLLLVAIFGVILRMHAALYTWVIALGAALWAVGNLLWLLGWPVHMVVWWWAGFLVLTIAGERLELSRLLRLSGRTMALFLAVAGLFLAGILWATFDYSTGTRLVGLGMIGLAAWLLRYDIAQRRLKAGGLARFIALSLLSGYVWLAVSGVLALLRGGVVAGPVYDAMLHALFLGHVFTMIFGHAPIIFPAVLGLPIHYSPRFYSHLILLHITLLLRLAGDLLRWQTGRLWGGLLNVVVLLLFLANTIASMRAGPAPETGQGKM